MSEIHYCIASLKHTSKRHEHITFWGPNHRGYVLAITDERVGQYTAEYVRKFGLNDGESCLAVPLAYVRELLSPEPYYVLNGTPVRFYDTPGPVVNNTRANWNKLIDGALEGVVIKPKPEVFRGQRRSYALEKKQ